MRHEPGLDRAETAVEMDADDITFEDLLKEETGEPTEVSSLAQLLAEGFPRKGGLAELSTIAQMVDTSGKFAALQQRYVEILEAQKGGQAPRV